MGCVNFRQKLHVSLTTIVRGLLVTQVLSLVHGPHVDSGSLWISTA
jgi:hypothetical protein